MPKILVIEDDAVMRDSLVKWLTHQKYIVEFVADAAQAMDHALAVHYDLLIVDWELPKGDGLDVVKQYREANGQCAVLMLTGRDSINDKRRGLETGADDYLTKPFDFTELNARVRALLRRSHHKYAPLLNNRGISLDATKCTVERDGVPIHLPPKEFAILELLMKHPGQPFTAESICERLWHSDSNISPESIRTYMNRLRAKINEGLDDPVLKTVWGRGYKFDG